MSSSIANGAVRQPRDRSESSSSSDEDEHDRSDEEMDDPHSFVHSQNYQPEGSMFLEGVTTNNPQSASGSTGNGMDRAVCANPSLSAKEGAWIHLDENNGLPTMSRQSVLRGLSEALMRRSLTKIDLSQRGLRPLDARLIKMALQQNKQIQVLKLGYNSLGDEGVQILCPAIAQHSCLESLDIGFNQVGNFGCKALMEAITHSCDQHAAQGDQRSWTLYLAGNLIGEDGAISIADLITRPNPPSRPCIVRRLYLTGNKLGPTGVKAIAEAVLQVELNRQNLEGDVSGMNEPTSDPGRSSAAGGLEELFLGGTHMELAGCSAVARLLAHSHCLKTVSLPNCEMTDEMLSELATSIKANRALLPLESLQLSFNQISCKGMEVLTNAIWASRSLKELSVDNNEIGDAGIQHLAGIMPGMKGPLEVLNVGFNRIKSSGMRALMKAVAESHSIRSISVAGNAIDTTSAKFIAYALAHNNSLLSISLDHCSIGQEGKRQIVAGIVSNSRTKLREVRGFNVGPVVVTLGFPPVMEHWNNEHVVNFVHLMWKRSDLGVNESIQDVMDPLHFLGSIDFANERANEKAGPHEASVVVEVAKKMFACLVEEGVDVFSRRPSHTNGYADASPVLDGLSSAYGFPARSLLASPLTNGHSMARPILSFVAPPEGSKPPCLDPHRKKRIVEWLCSNIQHLNKLAQLPFSSAELWRLHQHYFSPVVNESGGSVVPSPCPSAMTMSDVPEVSVTSSNPGDASEDATDDSITVTKSDPSMKGSPFVGLSPLPLLKRKVSYRFLGDATLQSAPRMELGNVGQLRSACSAPPAQNASVAMMIEEGPAGHTMPSKTKRARRNRTRISFLPKVKAKLDSYLDVCHEKALVTMRQLYYVEQAILGGQVNPIDPSTTARTHLCGDFATDAETIVCDMI